MKHLFPERGYLKKSLSKIVKNLIVKNSSKICQISFKTRQKLVKNWSETGQKLVKNC